MKWLPLGFIAVAAILPGSPPLQGAEPAPKPSVLAVMIGGGRTEDDAKKAIREFRIDLARVTPAEGYPKILSSDDLPGAAPDTYFAVLGYCDPVKEEKHVAKLLHAITTGAYSVVIAGKFENACPKLR